MIEPYSGRNPFKSLTIFAKSYITDVQLGFKCAFEYILRYAVIVKMFISLAETNTCRVGEIHMY